MNNDTKIIAGVLLATVLIIFGGVFLLNKNGKSVPAANFKVNNALLIKDNSSKISTPTAQATLVEFSDFQCPACGSYQPVLKQLLEQFKGKMNFVYRHFPLDQHKNALKAAYAAEAAGKQSKFWEMHDLLFENQKEWSDENSALDIFTGYAKNIGLNIEQYKKDVNSDSVKQKVAQDKADGLTLGINSTPTFFLGSIKLVNSGSYDEFKTLIDAEIAKNPIK